MGPIHKKIFMNNILYLHKHLVLRLIIKSEIPDTSVLSDFIFLLYEIYFLFYLYIQYTWLNIY